MSSSSKWKIFSNSQSAWKDRIPFILLFGISTSIELFQEKLTKRASRQLEGESLTIEQVDIEKLFIATQNITLNHSNSSTIEENHQFPVVVRIGPLLTKLITARQKENIQSPTALVQALKVR